MIPENTDLTQEAINKLPNQFYDKSNILALLSTWSGALEDRDSNIFNIVNNVNVEDATGYLLDCVGSYVAVLRNGDEDEPFRQRIRRQILTSSSEGTPNDMLELLGNVTKGTTKIWEHYPVSATYSTTGSIIPTTLFESMQVASPAASGNVVVYLDYWENSLIPVEIKSTVAKLINHNSETFITDYNPSEVSPDILVIKDFGLEGDAGRGLLSEFTYGIDNGTESLDIDEAGVLCEIVAETGGVKTFNVEHIELDNSINKWNYQMNYITPLQL